MKKKRKKSELSGNTGRMGVFNSLISVEQKSVVGSDLIHRIGR
jgi:hypothetical protein